MIKAPFYLYEITHIPTGRYYRGITCKPIDSGYLGSGTRIKNAVRKYGKDEFRRVDHAWFMYKDDAIHAESQWVTEIEVEDPKCFNLTVGGKGYRATWTNKDNTAKRMSKSALKRWSMTPVENRPVGERNPFYGKSHSDESRKKISDGNRGRRQPPEERMRRSEALKKYWEGVRNG